MTAAIKALLTNVIDYAGLFPPASLSLDESIRNYARYLKDPDRWMLGKFICPAGKLEALTPYVAELFATGEQLEVIALGQGGKTLEEFRQSMDRDQADIEAFQSSAHDRAVIRGFECKSPSEIPNFDSRGMFLESDQPMPNADFKLRTGGVEASAFPPVESIARALIACRQLNRPMKFTAGLHHPIRHFNKAVNTKMHGFINVFVAGVFAHAQFFDEAHLIALLSDEDAKDFSFEDDGLHWRDHVVPIPQIEIARKRAVISFGSCSFDEPREDLRALGWL